MRVRKNRIAASLSVLAMTVVSMVVVGASPASAAEGDSFSVWTAHIVDYGCGLGEFRDYGPGADGGGNNDDYIYIKDYCGDGHGVRVWAWQNGYYLGSTYLGGGYQSDKVWDPFFNNNVRTGDSVKVKVCRVDGPNGAGFDCAEDRNVSADG